MTSNSLLFIFCRYKMVILTLCIFGILFGGRVSAAQHVKCGNTDCCQEEYRELKLFKPYLKGDEVREVQKGLKKLGYYEGETNGIYDENTARSVKKFQKEHNLKIDGQVGLNTRKKMMSLFEVTETKASSQPSPKGTVEILIDADTKTLTILDDGKEFKKYRVAVGKEETPTPIGEWKVKRKAKNWGTGFGTRWMGLDVPWGIYGIHGTNKPWSIGGEESHGCIRMFNRSVEEIYPWVKVGTVVRVVGEIYPPFYEHRNKVFRGCKGSDVWLIQKGLIEEGYLKPPVDGIFGRATEEALKKLQRDRGFEVTGQVDIDIWPVLGL